MTCISKFSYFSKTGPRPSLLCRQIPSIFKLFFFLKRKSDFFFFLNHHHLVLYTAPESKHQTAPFPAYWALFSVISLYLFLNSIRNTASKNLLKTLFPIKVSPYETSITATCLMYFSLEELTVFPWWTPKHNSFHSDYRKSSSARNNS